MKQKHDEYCKKERYKYGCRLMLFAKQTDSLLTVMVWKKAFFSPSENYEMDGNF